MTEPTNWTLDRDLFLQTRARWISKVHPDTATIRRLNDTALDILNDPLHRGSPDPNIPDLYFARVLHTDIGILFGLNSGRLLASILEIG